MHKILARRMLAWVLSICMIAGMVNLSGFTVYAEDDVSLMGAKITLDTTPQVYDGGQKKPTVTEVKDFYDVTVDPSQYTVSYENNIDAGVNTAIVKVTNVNDEADFATTTFTIEPKSISNDMIAQIEDQRLVNSANPPTPVVTLRDEERDETLRGQMSEVSVAGVDFTYTFTDNDRVGTATVNVTGRNNYTGTATATFEVYELKAELLTFRYDPLVCLYQNGNPITRPKVTNVKYDSVDLEENKDYKVEYDNNRYATEDAIVRVVGLGRYEGLTQEGKFTISKMVSEQPSYGNLNLTVDPIPDQPLDSAGVTFTADEIYVYDPDYQNRRLEPDVDYTVSDFKNNTVESTDDKLASFKIKGTNNKYNGERTIYFKIVATQLSEKMIQIDDSRCKYDGTNQYDKVIVTVSNGTTTYVEGADYTVVPVDSGFGAGSHQLRVIPVPGGQLKGDPVTMNYTVKARELTDPEVQMTFVPATFDYTFDNRPKTPGVELRYKNNKLTAGQDYDLRYDNNTNAGVDTASVVAVGKGNFTGNSNPKTFTIKPAQLTEQNVTITGVTTGQEFPYTGRDIQPNINVQVQNLGTLSTPRDYTVEYANNLNVGEEAELRVIGTGNYEGTIIRKFKIVPRNLSDGVTITMPSSVEYTGTPAIPDITLNYNQFALVLDRDYMVEYDPNENIEVGSKSVTIKGIGNFTGETVRNYTITARGISAAQLRVTDTDKGYNYSDTTQTPDDRYYKYTGKEIVPTLAVIYHNPIINSDYTFQPGTDCEITFSKNKELGTAQVQIQAKGNYSGTVTYEFTIKGDLSDYQDSNGYTKASIPTQIYTSNNIVPTNADITFNGASLTMDTDYTITCQNNLNVGRATAEITGIGKYYNRIQNLEFDIRAMNLSDDPLDENGYVISNVEDSYVYSGFEINPVPTITHNGSTLAKDTHYTVNYNPDDVEKPNVNAGTGKLMINGMGPNYEGSHEMEFTIEKYDIGASYAEPAGNITVENLVTDVVLDEVIAGDAEGVDFSEFNKDAVVQTELEVMYTPVRLDGTKGDARPLDETEYSVSYENNTEIGTATITITGIGDNFTGTVTREFKIRGDLSAKSTTLEVEDWIYTPANADGSSTNTPEPVVKYTYTSFNGTKKTVELEKGVDYQVRYENYENATEGKDEKAKVIISQVEGADGQVTGNYVNSKEAEFDIKQRDLSNAIEGDGIQKDPDLDVTGLVEEGYEYTGSPIIPELNITCKGTNLSGIVEGTSDSDTYDYVLSVANNVDVYTYALSSTGGRERVYPTVTVTAHKNEDGEYDGNYKGGFQMEFRVNPRELSQETIDTVNPVAGIEPEMDYTGKPVTFPFNPEDPTDKRNAIIVTWSKTTQAGPVQQLLVENQDYKITYKDNVKIGEATVTISGVEESNYSGSYDKTFKIMASLDVVDQPNSYIHLEYDHNVPYGIVAVYPQLKFKDYSGVLCQESTEPKILEEGVDFEIVKEECKNNINVASENAENEDERPTVVIKGIGCYRGKITKYYNIIPKDLAADQGDITATFTGSLNTEEYQNAFIYTGEAITPEIEVYNHGVAMTPNIDYTIERYVNNVNISTEDNPAGVVIKAVEGGNYRNQKTLNFNIIRRPIDNMMVTITDGPQIYDRTEKKPQIEVSYMDGIEQKVLGPDAYDVEYVNNVNAASESIGEEAPAIIVTGKDAYGGTIRKTFTIEPESFAEDNEDLITNAANAFYTGEPATTTVEVKAKDGTILEENVDYTIGEYTDNIQAGTGYVAVHGMGNYTGTRQVPFYIMPIDAAGDFRISDIPEQEYNSKPITPEVSVSLGDTEIVLTPEKDYTVEYVDNTDAGTATVIVRGAGNFSGEAQAEFVINPKSIGTEEGMDPEMALADIEDQVYTGNGVTPDISLIFQRESEEINEVLELNRDYTLAYTGNVAVGTATVTITGTGNYSGSLQKEFRILGAINLADVPRIPVQQYTGEPVTPKPEVSFAGVVLVEGTDYTLEYEDNIARGTAKINITGMGWYTGTKVVTFDIAREFSDATVIKGIAAAYTYTGAAITPVVRVEDNGNILSKGVDYQVTYSDNVNAGTATVTITGINIYRGTQTATFKIMPQNLGRANVTSISDQTYDGKEKKPKVVVSSEGLILTQGTDYTISYSQNKNPGKASVVIKGKGNFTGLKTVNFNIKVPAVTRVKVSKYTDTSITFTWNLNKLFSGYEIYNSSNKKVASVRKKDVNKAKVSNLKAGTAKTFRVRGYVIKNGDYYYSPFVKIKASTAPKATKISSLTSKKSKQVVVKWKKIKGASSYEIYRSTSKKGTYKKLASTSKTSYTDKKATKGKTYYYKIRVCKKDKTGTYYSSYSSIKSVKAKK